MLASRCSVVARLQKVWGQWKQKNSTELFQKLASMISHKLMHDCMPSVERGTYCCNPHMALDVRGEGNGLLWLALRAGT